MPLAWLTCTHATVASSTVLPRLGKVGPLFQVLQPWKGWAGSSTFTPSEPAFLTPDYCRWWGWGWGGTSSLHLLHLTADECRGHDGQSLPYSCPRAGSPLSLPPGPALLCCQGEVQNLLSGRAFMGKLSWSQTRCCHWREVGRFSRTQ